MLRIPLSIVSPRGPRARLSILIFHRVLREPDPLFPDIPDARRFEQQMGWVRRWFDVLPLEVAVDRLMRGTLGARALAITFDDGYADNLDVAAPILRRLGLPATVFVSTGYLQGANMWNDRVIEAVRGCAAERLDLSGHGLDVFDLGDGPARRRVVIDELLRRIKHLPAQERAAKVDAVVSAAGTPPAGRLMLRPDALRSFADHGITIGAHTVSHPILATLPGAQALDEIRASKMELESMVGAPVTQFAYPNGVPDQDYRAEHVAMVRECGFACAVSTAWGAASRSSDRFQLPRFTPWDRDRLRFGARLLSNLRRSERRAA